MPNETMTLGDKGFFSPDAMIWQVDREMVLLLAGGRALLMGHSSLVAGFFSKLMGSVNSVRGLQLHPSSFESRSNRSIQRRS